MEKYRLSFAHVNVLDTHIAEVICDKNIEVTMEMIEEVEVFLCDFFVNDFYVQNCTHDSAEFVNLFWNSKFSNSKCT